MSLFWREVEISPIDLSYIRKEFFKKYSLEKMNVGDTFDIQEQERGELIKYTITKKKDEGFISQVFEFKKFIFIKSLYELEVQNEIRKTPEIIIPSFEVKKQ